MVKDNEWGKDFPRAVDLNCYPDVDNVDFPTEIYVAYAVCENNCGNKEFIVDGQTQVCQHCGTLMFRTETRKYILSK